MIIRKLAAVALLFTLGIHVGAQPKGSDSVVRATATASKPNADGKETVTIVMMIEPKYHLYANPVGLEDLESVQTAVSFKNGEASKISYPAGEVKVDKLTGNYKIYKNKVTITALIQRKVATEPIEATIKIQACTDKTCLMTSMLKLSVK